MRVLHVVVTTHPHARAYCVGATASGSGTTDPDGWAALTMGLNALPKLAVAMNRLLHEGQLEQLQQLASRLDAAAAAAQNH